MSDIKPRSGDSNSRSQHAHTTAGDTTLQFAPPALLGANVLSWERGKLRQALPLVVSRCMAFSAMTRFDDDLIAAVREFYGLELDVATAEAEILEDEDERIRFFPWFLWDWRVDDAMPTVAERFVDEAEHDRYERRLLEALCSSYVGFYEALEDASPRGVTLRDLSTGEEIHVPDEGLEGDLFAHQVLQARLLRIPTDGDGTSVLVDAVYACLPPRARPAIAAELASIASGSVAPHEDVTRLASAQQPQLLPLTGHRPTHRVLVDRVKAFTPELLHLADQLMESLARPPQAFNAEGDLLVLCTATLRMSGSPTLFPADVRTALAATDSFEPLEDGTNPLFRFVANGQVRGWVELKRHKLVLGANSPERLEALDAALSDALGRQRRRPMCVLEDFQVAAQRWAEQGGGQRWLRADPEVREATQTWLHSWARHWVDMPSAGLGDKTPREAVREADGRARVQAMLERFESLAQGQLATLAPGDRPQLDGIRLQLGLEIPTSP